MFRFFILFVFFLMTGCQKKQSFQLKPDEKTLFKVIEKIKKEYVDEVTSQQLTAGALNGIMRSLDMYSTYLPPNIYQMLASMTKGELVGIGLELIEKSGQIQVIAPLAGSPAQKAGILPGDIITHINNRKIESNTPKEFIIEQIRGGKPGTVLSLVIKRKDGTSSKIQIKKELLNLKPIQTQKYDDILYIKINYFSKGTAESLKKVLNTEKYQKIIIDLRNNPGGQVYEGISVSGLFLRPSTIVHVKSRCKHYNKTYYSDSNDITYGVPIVILINNGSASSSEIVAGALKDNKRATLVGQKSLGKGSIQEIIPLKNLGGIKMTIARFFTPNGFMIQDQGIKPDIEVDDPLEIQGSYSFNLDELYRIDPQFKKGVQYLKNELK